MSQVASTVRFMFRFCFLSPAGFTGGPVAQRILHLASRYLQ